MDETTKGEQNNEEPVEENGKDWVPKADVNSSRSQRAKTSESNNTTNKHK